MSKLTAKQQEELSPRQKQRLCERFNKTFLDQVVWLKLEDGREVLTKAIGKARIFLDRPFAGFEDYGLRPVDGDRVREASKPVFAYVEHLRELLEKALPWTVQGTAELEDRHPQAIINAIEITADICRALGKPEAAERIEEGKAKQVKRLVALAAFNGKEGE